MTTTEVAPYDRFNQGLEKQRDGITAALSATPSINPDYFIRTVQTFVRQNPNLLACTTQSLMGVVFEAAQTGLPIDSHSGFLYVYERNRNIGTRDNKRWVKEAVMHLGYKGLVQLYYRNGHVLKVEAHAVYERDHFGYHLGLDPVLEHVPSIEAERGELTHTYCIVKLKNGETIFYVATRPEIDSARRKADSKKKSPAWASDYEAMACKVAVRKVRKFIPAVAELNPYMAADELRDEGIETEPVETEHVVVDEQPADAIDIANQADEPDPEPQTEVDPDDEPWPASDQNPPLDGTGVEEDPS